MTQPGATPSGTPQPTGTEVTSHVLNGVLTLTMNRPESLNSANDALLHGLYAALTAAVSDQRVRVVVLTGAGRAFCAGADLSAMNRQGTPVNLREHLQTTFNPVITAMHELDKPVISAVNGVAAGAGASLALAGDIRLWSDAASAIQVFSNIGLIPDSGSTWLLPRLVGYHRAFELMSLAERVSPEDALRLGLCERVLPAADFAAQVQAYAERLAARPAAALALTKQALRRAMVGTLKDALETEAELQEQAAESWEHREGVQAFLEKRPADFLKQ